MGEDYKTERGNVTDQDKEDKGTDELHNKNRTGIQLVDASQKSGLPPPEELTEYWDEGKLVGHIQKGSVQLVVYEVEKKKTEGLFITRWMPQYETFKKGGVFVKEEDVQELGTIIEEYGKWRERGLEK